MRNSGNPIGDCERPPRDSGADGDSWNHIEDAWNHIKFGIYVSILGSQGHIRDSGKYQGLGSDIEESGSDSGD